MTRLLSIALLAAVAGCGPHSGHGTNNPGGSALMSIEVQPANATIAIDNGSGNAPIGYTAIGHFANGTMQPLADAVFSLDDVGSRLGAFAGAQFTASGGAAGTGHVTASSQNVSGSTGVTVTVHRVTLGPGVPPDAPGKLGGTAAPGALSPLIDYPLDGAVMPQSVVSPDVQWEGTAAMGDLFHVKLVAGAATVEAIVNYDATFTWDYQPSATDWSLLALSAGTTPIAVTVDHWDAASGLEGSNPVRVNIAAAEVRGAIYYWDLSEGKMQRIDDSGRNLAIPNPPPSPSDATNHCVACHTISRDGRYLAGELWGGGLSGAVFDLSNPAVTTGNPAPTLAPVNTYTSLFATFNPDASRLIINNGTSLALLDPMTGMAVPTQGTPLPTANAAHPTWSPDGTLIAYVKDTDGTWAVDYTTGNLATIAVTPGDTFGAPTTIVANATGDPQFKAPSWPSFSLDSQWIAYAAGTNSRGRNAVGMPPVETVYPGALFLVGRAGGTPVRLDNACSGKIQCYLPCFSPYDSGGYFWLVFYSLQDYGNAQAGTKGTQRRQMWVTAIDKSKLGTGVDPSSTPYWLPEQDPKTENMSAFWAPPPPVQ
ncbi:MAG TPA: hypothetical protein VN947_05465 [Polyangia bacterium]|nr:hypothetical protein [Polyangia bacterium]